MFLWVAKLALAGTTVCLVWSLLPSGPGRRSGAGSTVAAYLVLVLVALSGMMGQRLLASATGRAVDMTMRVAGPLDWGEPYLRDPIIFLAQACPVMVTAILGLLRGTEWGGRAAALSSAFLVSILSVVLFTGPLKEYVQSGSISAAMGRMSVVLALAVAPAVWAMVWLVRSASRGVGDAR